MREIAIPRAQAHNHAVGRTCMGKGPLPGDLYLLSAEEFSGDQRRRTFAPPPRMAFPGIGGGGEWGVGTSLPPLSYGICKPIEFS